MKGKRLLSILLVLCLTLALLPGAALPARAANADPEYVREAAPEYVLFNAISGSSEDFFKSVMDKAEFNAVADGKFVLDTNSSVKLDYGTTIRRDPRIAVSSGDELTEYVWEGFRDTNLARLSDEYDQLEAGLAVTLTNNPHDHKFWRDAKAYKSDIISYMDVVLSRNMIDMGDGIRKARGYSRDMTTLRRGNASFGDIPDYMYRDADAGENGRPLVLNYWNYQFSYNNGSETCSCGGSAKNTVVSFCDETPPELDSVEINVVRNGVSQYCWNFGKGETVNIEIICSEPIRFADDSASGKGDVCVGLMVDGRVDRLPAHLVSLNGNKLTFQYTAPTEIPAGETGIWAVTGIDLCSAGNGGGKALFSNKTKDTGIDLCYIYGSETYTAKAPASASSEVGYTESTCYVTDLAGNALTAELLGNYIILHDKIISRSFNIDIQDPTVVKAEIIPGEKYNADVKALLGKDGPGMTPGSANYEDPSDRCLGVGDSFRVKLYMNELVNSYTWPEITLNIVSSANPNWHARLYASKNSTAAATDQQYGLGVSKGQVTVLETSPLTITEAMLVDPAYADGVIRIESIEFDGEAKDYSNNLARDVTDGMAFSGDFILDTDLPVPAAEAAVQTGGVNESFYVPFHVADEGSGVQDLPGKVTLTQPNGATLPFLYAVTDSTDVPSKWNEGTMGIPMEFKQSAAYLYLHFSPVAGAAYNFNNDDPAALVFNLMDYAGNRGDASPQLVTGAAMDSLPPTVRAAGSSKEYDNESSLGGTLTVQIEAQDVSIVSAVAYVWQDADAERDSVAGLPASEWTDAFEENGLWIAEAWADTGALFQKNLWVRAEDSFGYASLTNLGEFSYDLASTVDFELEYSTEVRSRAGLTFTGEEFDTDEGAVVIDVMMEDDTRHYVTYLSKFNAGESDCPVYHENLFDQGSIFYQAGISLEDGVDYALQARADQPIAGDYTGNLYVTVYSGNYDTISSDTDGDETHLRINNNAAVQSFTLRQAAPYGTVEDVFSGDPNTIFTIGDPEALELLTAGYSVPWSFDSGERVTDTLEGIRVNIDLGGDKNGWAYEDVDWQNSGICTDNEWICAIGSGPVQSLILPASELYAEISGVNGDSPYGNLYLELARFSDPDHPYGVALCAEGEVLDIHLDDSEPGVLELQHLGIEYEYRDVFTEDRFHDVPFDPNATVYIPTESKPVVLSVEAMIESYDEDTGETTRESYDLSDDWLKGHHMDVVAWNTAEPEVKISLDRSWLKYSIPYHGGVAETEDDIQMYRVYDVSDYSGKRLLGFGPETDAAAGVIGLTPNEDNVIALQIVCPNGKASGITYLTVHPVAVEAEGTVTIETKDGLAPSAGSVVTVGPNEAAVVFTPSEGVNTLGLDFYVARAAYLDDGTLDYWEYEPIPMTARSDGSYAAAVPNADLWHYFNGKTPNENIYPGVLYPAGHSDMFFDSYFIREDAPPCFFVVYSVDPYGNEHVAGIADWGVIPDATPPVFVDEYLYELGQIDAPGDGTFTAYFRIADDSLYARDGATGEILPRPMELELFYDAEYAAAAGIPAGSLKFTGVEDGFEWTAAEGNDLGVYRVTAERTRYVSEVLEGGVEISHYVLGVSVEGVVSAGITDPTRMPLYLRAADAHGNTNGPVFAPGEDGHDEIIEYGHCPIDYPGVAVAEVTGAEPEVTGWRYVSTGRGDDMGLELTFNVPVLPAPSWMEPDPGAKGFGCVWQDAFPIWKDGEWEISFYDAFGRLCTQTLTLENVFGDYGIDLSVSPTEFVAPETGVIITAAADGDGETVAGSTVAAENGDYAVTRTADGKTDELTVHVRNIVTDGPECRLFFYLEEFGEMYEAGAADQFRGSTTAPVTVSYATDRETSPVGATTVTFTPADAAAAGFTGEFTFSYHDVATDATYVTDGTLEKYGISLAEPPEAYRDTEAPVIELVTLWTQRGGGFVRANAFPGGADETSVGKALTDSGPAQSYDFVVKASDYSPWKVLVTAAEPAGIDYDSRGDSIKGVSVQGNNVLVTKEVEGDFWIVAVDNASADGQSGADNYSWIRIPCSSYRFDTTPPVIGSVTVGTDLYSRTVYLRATDEDDVGLETVGTVLSGTGIVEDKVTVDGLVYTHRLIFTDNDTEVLVTATDAAGNAGYETVRVSGIDTSEPSLSVTWSPCFSNAAGDELDPANPPMGPVNVNVVAHITSSKPISGVTAAIDGTDLTFDADGTAVTAWGAVEYTAERITVRFTSSEEASVRLTVAAPNGKNSEVTVGLSAGVIDKDKPVVTDTVTPVKRAGFEAAWAEKHTLTFDEEVFSMSGGASTVYSAARPYEVTLTDGEARTLRFTDRAGNLVILTVAPVGEIDNVRPAVEAELDDDASADPGRTVTVTVTANEFCTLSCGDADVTCGEMKQGTDGEGNPVWTGTLTAARNGTFRVTAADAAGNTSDAVFTVNNVDRTLPFLSFAPSLVTVLQGSSPEDLAALLDKNVTCWDNVAIAPGTLEWHADGVTLYGMEYLRVDLEVPGVYEVPYTVEDTAGNVGMGVRFVRVVDKHRLVLTVDDIVTEMNGTTNLRPGTHTLSVAGLLTEGEPYTVKLVRGSWSNGQMKRAEDELLPIGEDGSFTLEEPATYTLYVVSQSRRTFRTLLSVNAED